MRLDTIYLGRSSVLSDTSAGLSADKSKPGMPRLPGDPDIADGIDAPDATPPRQTAPATGKAPAPWPAANEPPPTTPPTTDADTGDAGAAAIADANAGNPYKLVSMLVTMREKSQLFETADGTLTELGGMAAAMAAALGLSEAEARLLVDAMSRGGLDARLIAYGVNALRGMNAGDRAQWKDEWLPTALAGAQALIELSDNPSLKSLGATDSIVARLGELSELNFYMLNRNVTTFPNGDTVQKRAEAVRDRLELRVGKPQGPDALLGEIHAIDGKEGVDADARDAYAADLVSRYDVPVDVAYALVDALRQSSSVSRMIADGLNRLEALDQAKGAFVVTYFQAALDAASASASMQSDPFSNALGVMSPDEAAPVGTLANVIAAMVDYKTLLDRQARAAKAQAAKAAAIQ